MGEKSPSAQGLKPEPDSSKGAGRKEKTSMYDLTLDHEELSLMSNDNILKALQTLYPRKELYSISTGWRESDSYILKARGTRGDLVIGWKSERRKQNASRTEHTD